MSIVKKEKKRRKRPKILEFKLNPTESEKQLEVIKIQDREDQNFGLNHSLPHIDSKEVL